MGDDAAKRTGRSLTLPARVGEDGKPPKLQLPDSYPATAAAATPTPRAAPASVDMSGSPVFVEDPVESMVHMNDVEFKQYTSMQIRESDEQFDYVEPPKYTGMSFGVFPVDNPVRKVCIEINESQAFENIVVALIGINCVILALNDPTRGDTEGRNKIVSDSEPVFTALFGLEFAIKAIAMGFVIGPRSYLKDGWNVLDFIVVVASFASLGSSSLPGASSLRTIRVLRPLRTVSAIPGMRVLVKTMIGVVPMMANVALVCLFLFFVFGILGMQLFMGTLSKRCHTITYVEGTTAWAAPPEVLDIGDDTRLCTNETYSWAGRKCGAGELCLDWRNPERNIPGNPNMGITSFDSFLWASLTIFQCITLEGWTPIMYWSMDATSGWAFAYYVLLIFLGGFFVLNLALAVITDTYDGFDAEENAAAAEEKARAEAEEANALEEEARDAPSTPGGTLQAPAAPNGTSKKAKKSEGVAVNVPEEDILDTGAPKPINLPAICKQIIDHKAFDRIIVAAILLNTIFLSMEYHGMKTGYRLALDNLNLVLTILFALEAGLKLTGLGLNEYTRDRFNCFDMVVVIVSIVELLASGSGSLGALRAFRILRVMKLVRSWTSLRRFIATMWVAVAELGNFTFIVFLVIFVFALLGMQLFGGKFGEGDDRPRHHYDSFLWALVTVFQILTGEDWNAVMYDGMVNAGDGSALYFIALLLVGNFVVVNLFVAILLAEFGSQVDEPDDSDDEDEDEDEDGGATKYNGQFASLNVFARDKNGVTDEMWDEWAREKYTRDGLHRWEVLFLGVFGDRDGIDALKVEHAQRLERTRRQEAKALELAAVAREQEEVAGGRERTSNDNPLYEGDGEANGHTASPSGASDGADAPKAPAHGPMQGALGEMRLSERCPRALGFLDRNNPLREFCFRIADDKRFEYGIMMLIVVSSIIMATESPSQMEKKDVADTLEAIDAVFTTIFCVEMLIKLAAIGIARHPGSYCSDPWNVLDGTIVLLSIVSMPLSSMNLGWVRAVRTVRVLRPLRVISRVPELKLVVNALLRSVPGLGNVLFVSLLFWLIFGILAMQLFMGKFYRCDDGTEDNPAIALDEVDCKGPGLSWKNADMSFDNIGEAMLTLFEMSTTEGWTAVMYDGVDAVDVGKAPKRDHNELMTLFFVGFMIVGSFFIINLFIGIILDNFSALSREQTASGVGGSIFLTKEQQTWVTAHKKLLKLTAKPPPPPPDNQIRFLAYDLACRPEFEYVILAAIVLSTICMTLEYRGQSPAYSSALDGLDILFSAVFIIEAVVKIAAFGGSYFSENWNRFDFAVVIGSIVGFIAGTGSANFLRVFRLARVFRLVKRLKGLRVLFGTLITSLPTLGNIGALLLLLCFVYAVLGVSLFGKIKENGELNDHVNFRTFGKSLLVLLRMATGEAWNSIMYSCMTKDDCDSAADCGRDKETGEWNCCGNAGAPLYFASYVILGSFLTLNLLIAVVLENFSATKDDEDNQVTDEDLASFKEAWLQLDPNGCGFIPILSMPKLIAKVPPPLGLGNSECPPARRDILTFQRNLSVPVRQSVMFYQEALQAMICKQLKVDINSLPKPVRDKVQRQLKLRRLAQQRALVTDKTSEFTQADFARLKIPEMPGSRKQEDASSVAASSSNVDDEEYFTLNHYFALMRLQAAVRGFIHRKRMKEMKELSSKNREIRSATAVAAHVVHLLKQAAAEVQEHEREMAVENPPAAEEPSNEDVHVVEEGG